MSTIVTRAGKGSALTHNEVDANFVNLNNDKLQGTVAVANGGTGATDAATARTNLSAQETLVSGTNIKTINSTSILGSGNIALSGSVSDGDKGDITVTGSGATWTIDSGVVTDTKLSLSANASNIKTAINASGSAPIYACRAWVNFNGTGTVAIRASGNVSSITDNGVGTYAVNLTTAMSDANYCVQMSSLFSTAVYAINSVVSITTSVVNLVHGENNIAADVSSMYIAVFR